MFISVPEYVFLFYLCIICFQVFETSKQQIWLNVNKDIKVCSLKWPFNYRFNNISLLPTPNFNLFFQSITKKNEKPKMKLFSFKYFPELSRQYLKRKIPKCLVAHRGNQDFLIYCNKCTSEIHFSWKMCFSKLTLLSTSSRQTLSRKSLANC